MSDPYIGEIRIFAGNFAPEGWLFCQGQLLPIAQYEALYTLIGTTYGGDGQQTFNLPDLQGRLVVHQGTGSGPGVGQTYVMGQMAGVTEVTLTQTELGLHNHPAMTSAGGANSSTPAGAVFSDQNQAGAQDVFTYAAGGGASVALSMQTVTPVGGSQSHDNMQPYLVINYIISLFGIYPTQS